MSDEAVRRRLGAVLVAAGSLGFAALTWNALSPRADWHGAPIQLVPVHFRATLGKLGVDKLEHVLALACFASVVALCARLTRQASWPSARAAGVVAAFGWGLAIELLQGILPYRNFEALDLIANGVGVALASASLGALTRGRQQPRDARAAESPAE